MRNRILNISRYRNERGANLVEYGLVIACVTIVALPAVWTMGDNTGRMFCEISPLNNRGERTMVWDQDAELPCYPMGLGIDPSADDSSDDEGDDGSGYKPPPPPGWGS